MRVTRRELLLSLPALRLLAADQEKTDTTFRSDVNVVNVLATVRDKKGQIVKDLTKDDFTLQEDGRDQAIRYFSRESNLPLTLGLLVDTSLSQMRVLGDEKRASYRFFDQILREDRDLAFVIHFDHEVELLQDITSSRKQLEKALGELQMPERERLQRRGGGGGGYPGGGYPGRGRGQRGPGRGRGGAGTLLYDSILLASDEVMRKQHGRKALVLLTDGMDHGSKTSINSAIEMAQRSDTLCYNVLFSDAQLQGNNMGGFGGRGRRGGGMPQRSENGKKVLEQISRETGGGFFEVSKKRPIEKVFQQIEEELRNQYSIGYTPDKPGSGYRRITLATKQKNLTVRTREGYYGESK